MAALREFPLRNRERLTFEYVLLGGVNDGVQHAREMVDLIRGLRAKVNLIALNSGPEIPFSTPSDERVLAFQKRAHASGNSGLRPPPPRPRHLRCLRPTQAHHGAGAGEGIAAEPIASGFQPSVKGLRRTTPFAIQGAGAAWGARGRPPACSRFPVRASNTSTAIGNVAVAPGGPARTNFPLITTTHMGSSSRRPRFALCSRERACWLVIKLVERIAMSVAWAWGIRCDVT